MKKFDIILIDFPFEEENSSKVRPALVISNDKVIPIASRITTKVDKYKGKNDYRIRDWKEAGLLSPSIVRLDKKSEFDEEAVIKFIGHLSDKDIKEVEKILDKDESLKEDLEEISNGAPEAGEDTGVASILNTLIKSEYDAIEDYNSAIATIASRDSDYSEMINVLTDIVGEEQVHVGQLTEVMKLVSPNVEKQEDGKQEAQEQINEPVESEITESFENFSNDWADRVKEKFNSKYYDIAVKNLTDINNKTIGKEVEISSKDNDNLHNKMHGIIKIHDSENTYTAEAETSKNVWKVKDCDDLDDAIDFVKSVYITEDKKEKEFDNVYDWYKSRHPEDYQLDLINKKVTFTDLAKKLKKGRDRRYYRLDSEDVGVGEYIDSAPLDDITSETIRRVELEESRKNIKEEKQSKRAKLMSHI